MQPSGDEFDSFWEVSKRQNEKEKKRKGRMKDKGRERVIERDKQRHPMA